jgi:hypothetical protein
MDSDDQLFIQDSNYERGKTFKKTQSKGQLNVKYKIKKRKKQKKY